MLINHLDTSKNLLAFSGGVDSTSLFFILLEHNIPFDIAIVNYNQREQSKEEVKYALELAQKYNKICYVKEYGDEKFSEKLARDFRYSFFDEIIENEGYETLLTAHQLNDKLEWFMMQLSRGAGVVELIGLEYKSLRKNYTIVRPLLEYSKDELETYLQLHNHKYYIDATNNDPKYQRNYFRVTYANQFVKEYKDGIKKSFEYLQNDIDTLENLYSSFYFKELFIAKLTVIDDNTKMRVIDKELKKRGVLLSYDTKQEILRQNEGVVSHKFSVAIVDNIIFIAPTFETKMDKKFKEWCRIKKIPSNIRSYLSVFDSKDLEELF